VANLLSSDQIYLLHLAAAALLVLLLAIMAIVISLSIKRKKALIKQRRKLRSYKSKLEKAQREADDTWQKYEILHLEIQKAQQEVTETRKENTALQLDIENQSISAPRPNAVTQLEIQKSEVDTLLKDIRNQSRERTAESNLILKQAREQADSILTSAKLQAKEIAGEAWEAKNLLEFYRKTAVAMKNKIDGYGDDYLIPNETLLDDLADEFDYEKAGRQLKLVREQIKAMIQDGTAADCDYEEVERRRKSIEFALDAFSL